MKRLELTDSPLFEGMNHGDMLLEMCNELIGHSSFCGLNKSITFSNGDFEGQVIPWFEVCFVHLPGFLETSTNWKHSIAGRIAMHVQGFYHHPKHPVDYLYQEYKDKTAWVKTT